MDITHFNGRHYLSLVDCGPTRFTVWRRIRRQDSASIIQQLEHVFFERGAPTELLTDNDTAFRSETFKRFAERWRTRIRFRCAYAASGNGIVERCHRTVKRIAARMQCSIAEAAYWYNVSPKNGADPATAPANELYGYEVRVRGIDPVAADEPRRTAGPYQVGDAVWVKPPGSRCHSRFAIGTVTGVVSDLSVEVDGMPRHVRDLRRATLPAGDPGEPRQQETSSEDDDFWADIPARHRLRREEDSQSSDSEQERAASPGRPLPRRSSRERRPPDRYVP